MHLVTGFAILSGPYEYRLNRLPIVRMSGRVVNISGRRIRYGLVRFMKDAARMKNFWRSVAAEQLGYAPKAKRSEEHTSELQSLMRISYAVFCLKKQPKQKQLVHVQHR